MFKISQKQSLRFLLPLSLSAIAVVVGLGVRFSAAQSGAGANHPDAFSHALPQLDGKHLRATVVEVNYAPGEADKPHSHPCTVIGYVAQGAIRFRVKGRPRSPYSRRGKASTSRRTESTKYPPMPATKNLRS